MTRVDWVIVPDFIILADGGMSEKVVLNADILTDDGCSAFIAHQTSFPLLWLGCFVPFFAALVLILSVLLHLRLHPRHL